MIIKPTHRLRNGTTKKKPPTISSSTSRFIVSSDNQRTKLPFNQATFIKVQIGKHTTVMLVDTGNLTHNLVDLETFKQAYPNPDKRPKISPQSTPVTAAELQPLQVTGMADIPIRFETIPNAWKARCLIVKNLGASAKLGAPTMKKISCSTHWTSRTENNRDNVTGFGCGLRFRRVNEL